MPSRPAKARSYPETDATRDGAPSRDPQQVTSTPESYPALPAEATRFTARPYQAQAVAAILDAVARGENPVASLPTGSGKSVVVAALADRLRAHGRIVVTVPSRELAEQNERALTRVMPASDVGVVCAALGRREIDRPVVVGTPQSLVGAVTFDPAFVVVDEAHQMPLHRGSWFAKLFSGLPREAATRRIGLSATTFRTADGAIYGPGAWFDSQPFEIGVGELVAAGHLAPVRYVAPHLLMTTVGVGRSAGDYAQGDLVRANLDQVRPQVRVILAAMRERSRGMIFAVTVDHAVAYVEALRERGDDPALIVGMLKASERRVEVDAFRSGRKRLAVTVAAALTGFDVPDIDLIASCRPTTSPIVQTQSIGRGTRPAEGKAECLVLDFAGNVARFGPVHAPHFDRSGQPLGGVAPWHPCPACWTYAHATAHRCEHCGKALAFPQAVTAEALEFGTIDYKPEAAALVTVVEANGSANLPVESIVLQAYRRQDNPSRVSLMLSVALGGRAIVRMWFRPVPSDSFDTVWRQFLGGDPVPSSIEEAFARRSELIRPAAIDIERDGRGFWRLKGVSYGSAE